ncbi:MAG: hypothetical protein AAFY76_06360 [Cyanobacteria bacterium J06649_11]
MPFLHSIGSHIKTTTGDAVLLPKVVRGKGKKKTSPGQIRLPWVFILTSTL